MLDAEQQRRVSEAVEEEKAGEAERASAQAGAVAAMEEERSRRTSLSAEADEAAEAEVQKNRAGSLKAIEVERKERVSSNGTAPIKSPLKACFNALKKE